MFGNPFRKKFYKKISEFKIFLVDGELLKKKHIEFTEGTNFLVAKYVPKNEIWIDKYDKNIPAVIKHEVFEVLKMKKGMSYNKAHLLANKMEKKYRLIHK
jgi:hypothetical protein